MAGGDLPASYPIGRSRSRGCAALQPAARAGARHAGHVRGAPFPVFGRETVSFLLVLPLALPGIVTGMALNATINAAGTGFGQFTIIVGHATFCIAVVYNNAIARLRRMTRSVEEASADLGADPWQTFRYITLPILRGALLAGALLAFALSFDEVIVTTFTAGTQATLPIWILNNLREANQRPIINVVAISILALTAIPVYLSQRLAGEDSASVLKQQTAGSPAPAEAGAGHVAGNGPQAARRRPSAPDLHEAAVHRSGRTSRLVPALGREQRAMMAWLGA